jgi:hypothetical protein
VGFLRIILSIYLDILKLYNFYNWELSNNNNIFLLLRLLEESILVIYLIVKEYLFYVLDYIIDFKNIPSLGVYNIVLNIKNV